MNKIIEDLERKVEVKDPNYSSENAPTIKKVVIDCLFQSRDRGEMIARCMKIALAILDSDKVELTEKDHKLVFERIKANAPGYPNFAIYDALKAWDSDFEI